MNILYEVNEEIISYLKLAQNQIARIQIFFKLYELIEREKPDRIAYN